MISLIWLIPLFPLLGFAVNALFGGWLLRRKAVHTIACGAVFLSLIISLFACWDLASRPAENRVYDQTITVTLAPWMQGGILETVDGISSPFAVGWGFLFDPLSAVMVLIVTGVGLLIHVYSIGYMASEEGYFRFFAYMNLFMFSMLILVLGSSFLTLFLGWEGVGLCSYLLIGFYYKERFPPFAGTKAFLTNRIGDFGFLLSLLLIFSLFGTFDYLEIFGQLGETIPLGGLVRLWGGAYDLSWIYFLIALGLFVGATGKSAQIPLYVWLPDAMAGPTPVSALIHAATMVTAGVYMIVRANPLFRLAPEVMTLVAILGAATALFAASIALVQNDIKRVLAYSTISQLGYMFLAAGVGAFAASIFHLLTHAFFKALLFLCAGSVMHAMNGQLDMQKMGELRHHLPITYRTYFLATLAIAGIPFFSGFFSKDEILWATFEHGHHVLWSIGLLAALLTSFYMFRSFYLTFHGKKKYDAEVESHLHESPRVMAIPLVLLCIGAVFAGYIGVSQGIVLGAFDPNVFHHWLDPVIQPLQTEAIDGHQNPNGGGTGQSYGLEWLLILASVGVAVIGWGWARTWYRTGESPAPTRWSERLRALYGLLVNKYWVDEIYWALFVRPTRDWIARILAAFDRYFIDGFLVDGTSVFTRFTAHSSRLFDTYLVDGLCINGLGWLVRKNSQLWRRVQTGQVQSYALFMVLGAFIILCFYLFTEMR